MSVKLAAILIVKGSDDEAKHLQRCLQSIEGHVDGIFLNINTKPGHKPSAKVKRVAESFTKNIIYTAWHDDFAEARNANLAQVPEDYTDILYLDTDDTVEHPEKMRKIAEVSIVDAVFVDYLYEQDGEGNTTTVHLVARLFKNNGSHRWLGRIHETLTETRGASQGATKDFKVIHHTDDERAARSHIRNVKMLEMQLNDEGDSPDPRTICYLARAYYDSGFPEKALPMYEAYIDVSGWDQERAGAYTKLGLIYLGRNDHTNAKKYFMLGMGEDPDDPTPRVEMGSLELELKQFHKARRWLESVENMEKNLTTLERNPLDYTFRTYLLLADVYMGLGGSYLDKSLEYAKRALKYKKKDKNLKEYVRIIEKVVEDKHLTEKILDVVKRLKKNKEDDKIKSLLYSVPKQLDDNPLILRLRNEPKVWPQKSIAIMCGDSADEDWGPWSLEKGIGGSEEAVIRLSKHLSALGYKVVIFGKPMNNAGLHDGVMWRNFWEVNLEDIFDIFIGWRSPSLFDHKIVARKRYLWLHDVIDTGEFTPERLLNIDKVMVLSDYHRSLFPNVPDDKIFLTANGIDPKEFESQERWIAVGGSESADNIEHDKIAGGYLHKKFDKVKRDPHKIFYGSSHVRGLQYLYEIWPEVKKAVPDATLDVFYGRETYDAINAGNPERLKWMDDIQQQAKELDGVTDHGKVSQSDIVRHAFESGIWAYPTPFPEISCITAQKNQAAGAIPVVSDYAALKEAVQFGEKIELGDFTIKDIERYRDRLIWWLKHPEEQEKVRPNMMKWARENFDWANVAKQWGEGFES